MSRLPPAYEGYTRSPVYSDDDLNASHQPLHVTSSTNLTDQRFSMSPHRRSSDSAVRQVVGHSGNSSPGSPYEGFEWQPIPTDRRNSESHSPSRHISEPSGAALSSGYRGIDVDSLLEHPLPSPSPELHTRTRGHRSASSSLGSIITRDGQSSGRGSVQRGLSATIGDKSFRSPIILRSSPSGQLRSMHPQEVIDQRSQMTATWGIYWYLPSMMIAVFLIGLLGAVCHHVFYKSLDGAPSKGQLARVRMGTAFAFFVKANLVGAVVLAYRQRIWLTLRRKPMKIKAIDAMFGVIEDPTFFFTSPEMIKNAKVASAMALLTWLLPIASVLSPSSLTSEVSELWANGTCTIPTLNFSAENDYDFRNVTEYFGNSLAFYNYSVATNKSSAISYDSPSFMSRRLAQLAILNHGFSGRVETPCLAYNCTYEMEMPGPGYKCNTILNGSMLYQRMPEELKDLAPSGKYIYYGNVTQGDFLRPNLPPSDPDLDPGWIDGTFLYEPELWLGYAVNKSTRLSRTEAKEWVGTNGTARWTHKLEPVRLHCVHYHVNYTFNVSFVNEQHSVNVTNIEYIRPLMDTVYGEPDGKGGVRYPDRTKFIRPGQAGYKLVSAYHALGAIMRGFLEGSIIFPNNTYGTYPITAAGLSMTNLVDPKTSFIAPDLEQAIKDMHQDILITLWRDKTMVIYANQTIPCIKTRYANLFKYYARNLWIGYSIAVFVTLVAIGIGVSALYSNGISSDTLFSRILVTTRNPTLDNLSRGACLGSDPFPRELEETELRFGVLHEGGVSNDAGLGLSEFDGKPKHCAFGTVHETTDIVKGEIYAGLDIRARRKSWGSATVDVEQEMNKDLEGCLCGNDHDEDIDCDSFVGKDQGRIPLLRKRL